MNPMSPDTHERAHRARATAARIALAGSVLVVVAYVAACRVPLPAPAPSRLDEPNADEVERVVFLIGDAGQALPDKSPVIARLSRDVEAWAGGLGEDSAVTVIFLGDNVYPVGIRPVSDPEHAADTLRLRTQLDVVAGPHARE